MSSVKLTLSKNWQLSGTSSGLSLDSLAISCRSPPIVCAASIPDTCCAKRCSDIIIASELAGESLQ